jgi:hypothetical protein
VLQRSFAPRLADVEGPQDDIPLRVVPSKGRRSAVMSLLCYQGEDVWCPWTKAIKDQRTSASKKFDNYDDACDYVPPTVLPVA